jgi:hypothetical protein
MFIAVPLTSCAEIICANIKSLRPIAVLLSSGKSYERQREQQRKEHREKNEETAGTEERQQDDAIFPDAVEDKK